MLVIIRVYRFARLECLQFLLDQLQLLLVGSSVYSDEIIDELRQLSLMSQLPKNSSSNQGVDDGSNQVSIAVASFLESLTERVEYINLLFIGI